MRSSQRTDCDNEALRVVALINPKNLRTVLGGNASGMIEIPFEIDSPIFRENGYEINYFDQDKRPIFEPSQAKYFKKFKVDTLSGIHFGDILYFEKGKKEPIFKEYFAIDSSQVYRPGVLEDSLQNLIKINGRMQGGYREDTFKATNLKSQVVFRGVYS